jgi:hypothetical protein
MTARRRPCDDELRSLLRSGDPASADPGPDASETARLRRRLLEEASAALVRRAGSPRRIRLLVAAAVPATALLAALALWNNAPSGARRPAGTPGAPAMEDVRAPEPAVVDPGARRPLDRRRTIHFETRGGTRVVWSLDPDFDV